MGAITASHTTLKELIGLSVGWKGPVPCPRVQFCREHFDSNSSPVDKSFFIVWHIPSTPTMPHTLKRVDCDQRHFETTVSLSLMYRINVSWSCFKSYEKRYVRNSSWTIVMFEMCRACCLEVSCTCENTSSLTSAELYKVHWKFT